MAYTREWFRNRFLIRPVIHQPGTSTTAQLVDLGQPQGASVKMLPIENFNRFCAVVTASALTGNGVTAFSIYAGTDAAGTTPTEVVAHAVGTAPDAEGDTLFIECDVDQIHAALATATHVGVWLDCANDADEIAVTMICGLARFEYEDLTADYTAA